MKQQGASQQEQVQNQRKRRGRASASSTMKSGSVLATSSWMLSLVTMMMAMMCTVRQVDGSIMIYCEGDIASTVVEHCESVSIPLDAELQVCTSVATGGAISEPFHDVDPAERRRIRHRQRRAAAATTSLRSGTEVEELLTQQDREEIQALKESAAVDENLNRRLQATCSSPPTCFDANWCCHLFFICKANCKNCNGCDARRDLYGEDAEEDESSLQVLQKTPQQQQSDEDRRIEGEVDVVELVTEISTRCTAAVQELAEEFLEIDNHCLGDRPDKVVCYSVSLAEE